MSIIKVNNEALAHIVANEWLSQDEEIYLNQMHITGLCNTSIDNPGKVDNKILVSSILSEYWCLMIDSFICFVIENYLDEN